MCRLFESADNYLRACSWRDLALVKFCVCAMGVLIGLCVPPRRKKPVAIIGALVFVAAFIPLILKFLPFLIHSDVADMDAD